MTILGSNRVAVAGESLWAVATTLGHALHDVGAWVDRHDATGWSALIRNNGRVVVGEVLR